MLSKKEADIINNNFADVKKRILKLEQDMKLIKKKLIKDMVKRDGCTK